MRALDLDLRLARERSRAFFVRDSIRYPARDRDEYTYFETYKENSQGCYDTGVLANFPRT